MQETEKMRVRSLGQEEPLEEGMATHSSVLARKIPWTEKPVDYSPCSHKESNTAKVTEHSPALDPALV